MRNQFRETQHQLGLFHQKLGKNYDELKSTVAFITAGLHGYRPAKDLIQQDIIFDDSMLGFSFAATVTLEFVFYILQSLYANDVIENDVYFNALIELKEKAVASNSSDRIFSKIYVELALNSPPDQIGLHLQNALESAKVKISKKNFLNALLAYNLEQYINTQSRLASKMASANLLKEYFDDIASPIVRYTSLIMGGIFGFLAATLIEIPLGIPMFLKYIYYYFDSRPHCNLENPELGQRVISHLTKTRNAASRGYLVFAESGIAMLGSWVGRALGFLVGSVAAIIASMIAWPLYYLNKTLPASEAKRAELGAKDKVTLLTESGVNIGNALKNAARFSLYKKGHRAKKCFHGSGLKLFNSSPSAPPLTAFDQNPAYVMSNNR